MRKLAFFPIAALLTAALPASAASGCDAVLSATLRVLEVPAHLYMTETAGLNGSRTRNAETIYLNGATFVMFNGHWRKSPVSPKELQDAKKETEQKVGACTVVRDEAVNGEAATFYKIRSQTAGNVVDTQIWVSKSRGLPLKEINDINVGGGAGKSHTEIRYEYTNVSAPAITEPRRR